MSDKTGIESEYLDYLWIQIVALVRDMLPEIASKCLMPL